MSVTVNGAIQLAGNAPGVDGDSLGTQYTFDAGNFAGVVDGIIFTGDAVSEEFANVGIGAQTTIDGVAYTLTGVFEFIGQGETINLETGETTPYEGQFVAFTLVDEAGNALNFVAPANSLLNREDWTGDPINTVIVSTKPFDNTAVSGQIEDDGSYVSKISEPGPEIPCFVAGTLIDTRDGPKPVEDLRPGDLVLTRDNGYLPLVWVGMRVLDADAVAAMPEHAPVRIAAGALGAGLPLRDTRVSPQHRMLVSGPQAELLFGEREVLVPAQHLVGMPGVTRDAAPVTYVHVMFDSHEIIRGDGAWSESFQPADWSLAGLDAPQRAEIFALFPELADTTGRGAYASARMTLKPHEARALLSVA